jgi:repressor LexA
MANPKKNSELFIAIENYINQYKEKYSGASPTVRDMAEELGVNYSTVSRYLKQMREEGIVEYDGHRNITTRESKITRRESLKVAVLGSVACGVPKFAEENIEEYVRLPIYLFGTGDFYILRANGDSMINAGIDDGDLVLVCQQNYADAGQIVVALMDDEATLKRYYPEPENKRVRLHPENDNMSDIYVSECLIQGVAIKVIKNLG